MSLSKWYMSKTTERNPSPQPLPQCLHPKVMDSNGINLMNEQLIRHASMPMVLPLENERYSEVSTLQCSALTIFAGVLIINKIKVLNQNKRDELWSINECDMIEQNEIPTCLLPKINSIVNAMKLAITNWLEYHQRLIFFDHKCNNSDKLLITIFDDIVWCNYGTINATLTAKKMVKSKLLANVEKYRMACVYCLEDDVKDLHSILGDDIIAKDCRKHHPFVMYWNTIIRHQQTDDKLFEWLINSPNKYEFCLFAFTYVWNKILIHDRITKVKFAFNVGSNRFIMWHMLSNLNDEEFNTIIEDIGLEIFKKFSTKSEFGKQLIMIWDRIVDRINVQAFEEIFKIVVHYAENDIDARNLLRFELWDRAPERLKQIAVSQHAHYFLARPYNFRLIIDVLSRMNDRAKKQYWKEHFHLFYTEPNCDRIIFEEIMQLCFRSVKELVAFKIDYMSDYEKLEICVRELCTVKSTASQRILRISPFKQIQKLLNSCCHNSQQITKLKTEILNGISIEMILNRVFKFTDPDIITEFNIFLYDAFTLNPLLNEYKSAFLSSDRSIAVIKSLYPNRLDRLLHIMKLVDVFSTTNEDMSRMKNILIDITLHSIDKGQIVSENINSKKIMWKIFFEWCFDGNKEDITNFKQRIAIDEVFKKSFRLLLRTLQWDEKKYPDPDPSKLSFSRRTKIFCSWMPSFCALDSFLEWFFDDGKAIAEFQNKVIENCTEKFANEILVAKWKVKFPNYHKRMLYILKLWYKMSDFNRVHST